MRALVLAAALALAACAEADAPPPAFNPYAGSRWAMTEGGGNAPTIEFSDSRASGHAGCNRWFAQVQAHGETLSFSAVGATRRACESAVMALEREFLADLAATRTARLENELLVLRDESGAELARFTRDR